MTSDDQLNNLNLQLTQNPDILTDVAKSHPKIFTVGFAAETQDLESNAQTKLKNKGVDMIATNDVSQEGIGFDQEENALKICWKDGDKQLPRARKISLANELVKLIVSIYQKTGL